MDSIDRNQIPVLVAANGGAQRVLKNTLHDGCFRAGGRGGGRLTRDWQAKWTVVVKMIYHTFNTHDSPSRSQPLAAHHTWRISLAYPSVGGPTAV